MTAAAATPPIDPPAGWQDLRGDPAVQFAPVEIPDTPPPEPNWLQRLLNELFEFLADLLGPVGAALGGAWWWLQWALLAVVAAFAVLLLVRLYAPGFARRKRDDRATDSAEAWQPDRAASLALLEDADALAAAGLFDAATRLLLQRSVLHIASARPDWVEPSSTARELAALPALPGPARTAFAAIVQRVERSAFALRALDRSDWEAARAAYTEFALARLAPTGVAA